MIDNCQVSALELNSRIFKLPITDVSFPLILEYGKTFVKRNEKLQ